MKAGAMFAAVAIGASAIPTDARAGCGSAVCAINTNWDAQGAWEAPGLRLDLRFEFIDQDQPRSGARKVDVGEIPRDHDELKTVNRNWTATLDYAFESGIGVAVSLPLHSRSHLHLHNDPGGAEAEGWNYAEPGDARVLARYRVPGEAADGAGVLFGVKLPTGRFRVANGEGERAERTLQPGTGTTDALLGAYYRIPASHGAWFVQGLWQSALGEREEYRPGDRLALDLGYRHPVGDGVEALLQVNLLYRARDRGGQAEPQDSGGRSVFLSPGLSARLGKSSHVYGFVQFPLYQYVNGVQLTSDWSAMAGFATGF